MTSTPDRAATPAHLGWRLLALVYDLLPALALWFVASALVYALRGGTPVEPGSVYAWIELGLLWGVTGLYAVISWQRGGQTLGMRPWRLKVVAADGRPAEAKALWTRYAVATLSLLAAGLGFWWALLDREQRTWHDLASGTRFVRLPKG